MKKYLLGTFAIALAIGFSAFSAKRADVTLYFSGNPLVSAQVSDESLWREDNSTQTCTESNKACAIVVDHTYLNGIAPNRTLNTSFIQIGATPGALGATNGYIPEQNGGTGSLSDIQNKQ